MLTAKRLVWIPFFFLGSLLIADSGDPSSAKNTNKGIDPKASFGTVYWKRVGDLEQQVFFKNEMGQEFVVAEAPPELLDLLERRERGQSSGVHITRGVHYGPVIKIVDFEGIEKGFNQEIERIRIEHENRLRKLREQHARDVTRRNDKVIYYLWYQKQQHLRQEHIDRSRTLNQILSNPK